MAISNYDELVKKVIKQSFRDDLDVEVPDFIHLAEIEMYNNQREALKIRDMETIQTATTTTGKFLSLPDNFESTRSIRLDLEYGELGYQSPEQMRRYQYTGRPQFFTIVGNEIEFDRVPDNEYTVEIQCYVRPLDLSVTNQTNSVLDSYPNIYLFGALSQLYIYAQDDQQAIKYDNLFINAILGANKSQKKGRYGPAPTMNLDNGMTP